MNDSLDRRKFIADSGKIVAGLSLPFAAGCAAKQCVGQNKMACSAKLTKDKMIWGELIALGYNMWADRPVADWSRNPHIASDKQAQPYLRFDESLWRDVTQKMSDVGMNMVVMDLGEGIAYKSHPEIGVEGSWTHKKMRQELTRLSDLGIEAIPKLNFSTGHDTWLGKYNRMVSTKKYYEVCRDLIEEVSELFDRPRFFHLGYDEENALQQQRYNHVIIRQHELWWHDFYFFVEQVEKNKIRPWIWSDYAWKHPDTFYEKMPKSVLQSNWYYRTEFDKYPDKFGDSEKETRRKNIIGTYIALEKAGFDQVPTGGTWSYEANFGQTVDFCKKHINKDRLKGFLQTPWVSCTEVFREQHLRAVELVGEEIKKCNS